MCIDYVLVIEHNIYLRFTFILTNSFCCVLPDGFLLLSLFAPPGVGFSVFLCQRSYFLLPLPIFLLIFFLYALPICSGDHGVLGDQHLDQHEMLLCGIGPDLTAMPVAEVQPATILAVRD